MLASQALLCSLWFVCFLHIVTGEEIQERDDSFVDPFDMFNFDPVHVTMMNKEKNHVEGTTLPSPTTSPQVKTIHENECKKSAKTELLCPPCPVICEPQTASCTLQIDCPPLHCGPSTVLFKQYIQQVITMVEPHVGGSFSDNSEVCLQMSVSAHHLHSLRQFSQSESSDVHEAHESLTHMLHKAHRVETWESRIFWMEQKLGLSAASLYHLAIIIPSVGFILHAFRLFRWHQLIPLVFAVSVVFTWFEMFQKEQANQEKILSESLSQHCPSLVSLPWYDRIASYVGSAFTFQDENCREFYQASIVNPLFKVNPMEACAIVLVKTVTAPLEVVGVGLRRFLVGLLKDLPFQHQTYMMVFLALFTMYLPLVLCGYRVRIPFLLAIERTPADVQPAVKENDREAPTQPNTVHEGLANLPERLAALSLDPPCQHSSRQCQHSGIDLQHDDANFHPDGLNSQQNNLNRRFTYPHFENITPSSSLDAPHGQYSNTDLLPQTVQHMPMPVMPTVDPNPSAIGFEGVNDMHAQKNPFQTIPYPSSNDLLGESSQQIHDNVAIDITSTGPLLPYPPGPNMNRVGNQQVPVFEQVSNSNDVVIDKESHSSEKQLFDHSIVDSVVGHPQPSVPLDKMSVFETETTTLPSKSTDISNTETSTLPSDKVTFSQTQTETLSHVCGSVAEDIQSIDCQVESRCVGQLKSTMTNSEAASIPDNVISSTTDEACLDPLISSYCCVPETIDTEGGGDGTEGKYN